MPRLPAVVLVAFALAVPGPTQSRLTEHTLSLDEGQRSPPATIADVAWLTGRWVGTGFGGKLEENWGAPMGGAMAATFRVVKGDAPQFYEICLLVELDGSLVYKVKHFHADLTGWEKKDDYVTFPLVKVEGNTAWFGGLTLEREGNVCTHYLAMRQKDGSHREEVLRYDLVAGAPSPEEPERAHDVSLGALEPLLGSWGPVEDDKRIVHDYQWTVGRHAMRLREGFPSGEAEKSVLDGVVFGDPRSGQIQFVAVAGPGKEQGRLFRGHYRALADGRIEREYTVWYRTLADTPAESLGGISRRYREVYTVNGDRLDATLEWWRDGRWQPFAMGKYSLVRREG